jgi:hypothetical protein
MLGQVPAALERVCSVAEWSELPPPPPPSLRSVEPRWQQHARYRCTGWIHSSQDG